MTVDGRAMALRPGTTLRSILAALDATYPPALAEEWDVVGLACGDPDAHVTRVLFAVDPVLDVVHEAQALGAELIVTHHPLLLRGVHSVARTDHKGSVIHECIASGIALFHAHTNADHARPGVSDALADVLGVIDTRPLVPSNALFVADAPMTVGDLVGTGRVGHLAAPVALGEFAERVAAALPATAQGVRVSGDLDSSIRTVAVCGGSGDAFLGAAAAAADVYVTSDLRHHRAQDHLVDGGCALIDVAHWAGEWPWLPVAAARLVADLDGTVDAVVSTIVTDPWTAHRGSSR